MPSIPNDEIPIGRIAGLFGIRGELKCDPSNAGRILFSPAQSLRIMLADGSRREVEIESVREHQRRLLIRLAGVACTGDAQLYVGATFYAERDRIPLEPGEYLDRDLAGCDLLDASGHSLGRVTRVEHYPSSDMLVVAGKLVPMVRAFIMSIDIRAKRIVVNLPAGLLDDDNAG